MMDAALPTTTEAHLHVNTAAGKPLRGRRSPSDILQEVVRAPVEQFLARGGKRYRAELVALSYRLAGGRGPAPEALQQAIEMLHAGSLIIDDIEDHSSIRRGQPALHCVVGTPLAINTGNWMYFRALEVLTRIGLSPQLQARVAARFATTIRRCHEGQAMDLSVQVHELLPVDVPAMAVAITTRKTGGFMALAAWLGALTAGGDSVRSRALQQFGRQLGIGLQMINDLHELKSSCKGGRCDDLRNGRVTWPWAWLAETVPADDFLWLSQQASQVSHPHQVRGVASQLHGQVVTRGTAVVRAHMNRACQRLQIKLGTAHRDQMQPLFDIIQRVQRSDA